jgi:two-component system chemotaxis response regulator CheY
MPKILVVDDTPAIRDIITIFLELGGFDVIIANDGEQGIEQARSQDPDLIITDINMPRVDGAEMISKLRATPEYKEVPILGITGYGKEKAAQAVRAGANLVLAHPVEQETLLAVVSDLLKLKQRSVDSLVTALEEVPVAASNKQ